MIGKARFLLLLGAAMQVAHADVAREEAPRVEVHHIQLVERLLYGPGPMPDQKLDKGHVHNMQFDRFMHATVPGANNGGDPPNVSGERLQGTTVDGKLSDGTLINENIDMGNALLLQGRFNLLLGAVHGGPSHGDSRFFLDRDLNWTIKDDIAIDPGFAEGVIKIHDFVFTTGPAFVPTSVQTSRGHPGGVDMVGSLTSRDVLSGRLGDDNFDGRVDGVFMALGNFPLDSILLPGAPFVQSIKVDSDIPLHPLDAAMLSLAAARNHLKFLSEHRTEGLSPASLRHLIATTKERLELAVRHLQRAGSAQKMCGSQCGDAQLLQQRLAKVQITEDVDSALSQLDNLDAAVAQLSKMHRARTGREVI